jgi:Uma2 family endonuclease
MANPARQRATYEDVLAAPEHLTAELIDGELFVSPRPALGHTAAASALGEELGPPFKRGRGGPGGWILLDEPELHLGGDVLVPDLAGWRRERLKGASATDAFLTVAPDWICEVLSPGRARHDRSRKLPLYAREGVEWAWLVDPIERLLESYQREGTSWRLLATYAEDARVRAPPFDAIELELSVLWADLAAPAQK